MNNLTRGGNRKDNLTRGHHPDLRMFTQVPGKLAWYSNKSYKTRKGAETYLHTICLQEKVRRGIKYSIIQDQFGAYRILAKPVGKEG